MKLSREDRAMCNRMRPAFRRAANKALSFISGGVSGVAKVSEETYVHVCFWRDGRRLEIECVASNFLIAKHVRRSVVRRVSEADVEALNKFLYEGPEELLRKLTAASAEVLATGVTETMMTAMALSGRGRRRVQRV